MGEYYVVYKRRRANFEPLNNAMFGHSSCEYLKLATDGLGVGGFQIVSW